MTPRQYNLGKRAELKEETRRRIVEATFELHGEQGILATSMQDVADRADVALRTVYRYFPTIDDLVQGCARRVEREMAPPGLEIFAGIEAPDDRLRVFVSEMFAMYERGDRMLEVAHCDADEVPALASALEEWERHHAMLAGAALRALGATAPVRREVLALTDYFSWRAFARHGVSTKRAAASVTEAVLTRLANERPRKGGSR